MTINRLQQVDANVGSLVMVIGRRSESNNNENDYCLFESNLIRKGKRSSNEPEFIIVIDENMEHIDLFKKLSGHNDNDTAICWQKVSTDDNTPV